VLQAAFTHRRGERRTGQPVAGRGGSSSPAGPSLSSSAGPSPSAVLPSALNKKSISLEPVNKCSSKGHHHSIQNPITAIFEAYYLK